jgi:hypothetical protein
MPGDSHGGFTNRKKTAQSIAAAHVHVRRGRVLNVRLPMLQPLPAERQELVEAYFLIDLLSQESRNIQLVVALQRFCLS